MQKARNGDFAKKLRHINDHISCERVSRILSNLIAIPSPSGQERLVLEFVEHYLSVNDIKIRKQLVRPGRYNLIATCGSFQDSSVLFNTHVDTVPSYKPIQMHPYQKGAYMYGRGACDAKGSVTSMLLAFEALALFGELKKMPVTLALMVGEENSGDGVARFVKEYSNFLWALVGEPTNLEIANSQAGYIEILIESKSISCHAFDPIGDQALVLLARAISSICENLEKQGRRSSHGFVRWIQGGSKDAFWCTRPSCAASILINTLPNESQGETARFIKHILDYLNKNSAKVKLSLHTKDWDNGVFLSDQFWGIRILKESLKALGLSARKIYLPSWTDGSTLFSKGIPTVMFGPGSLRDAHTLNERVRLRDVRAAALCLARTMLKINIRDLAEDSHA